MIKQEYSRTRTRATWKPRVTAEDIPFFEDEASKTTFVGISAPPTCIKQAQAAPWLQSFPMHTWSRA